MSIIIGMFKFGYMVFFILAIIGLISPKLLKLNNRSQTKKIFFLSFGCFIVSGIAISISSSKQMEADKRFKQLVIDVDNLESNNNTNFSQPIEPVESPPKEIIPELTIDEKMSLELSKSYKFSIECATGIIAKINKIKEKKPNRKVTIRKVIKKISDCEVIEAKLIHSIYKNNEMKSDNFFKGQRRIITGKADRVSKSAFGGVYVPLKFDRWGFESVHLEPASKSLEYCQNINKGDKIYASCVGQTMIMGIPMFDDCFFF